jgi:hypothetical protein
MSLIEGIIVPIAGLIDKSFPTQKRGMRRNWN